jgi:hypothetical protein
MQSRKRRLPAKWKIKRILIIVSFGNALGVGKFTGREPIGKRYVLLFGKRKKFLENGLRVVG